MKTIKVNDIKELAEMLLDVKDDPSYGGNEVEYWGLKIDSSCIYLGFFDDDDDFESELYFSIKTKGNILSVDLSTGVDNNYEYFLHFEIKEPFKRATYKIANPFFEPPKKEENGDEEEVIKL